MPSAVRISKAMKKIYILIPLLLVVVGCASTWKYDNIQYDSSASALQAAKQDVQRAVNGVEPIANPYNYSARIVTPSYARIRDAGVVKTGNATVEQINYIADVLEYGYQGMVDAIKRRNLFSAVSIERKYDTGSPAAKNEDYTLWIHMTDKGQAQWYIRDRRKENKELIAIDQAKVSTERVLSFLNSIESKISIGKKDVVPERSYGTVVSTGTGFIVSQEGHMLTNAHVVDGCKKITTWYSDKTEPLDLIAADEENDLALLSSGIHPEIVANFAGVSAATLGQDLVVSGYPLSGLLSDQVQLTTGVLSATSGINNDFRYFQLTAPVQQGNSGGPVLNDRGEVIGIVVSKLNAGFMQEITGDIPQNINFAIKSAIAKIFLDAYEIKYIESKKEKKITAQEVGKSVDEYTLRINCMN